MTFTSAQLAALSEDQRRLLARLAQPSPAPALSHGPGPFPLSFAQERMWLIDRFEPGTSLYNVTAAWRIDGHVDDQVLRCAFADVLDRHEALRVCIREYEDRLEQTIEPAVVPFEVIDLCQLAADVAEREAWRHLGQHAEVPFDLSRPPFMRVLHVRLRETSSMLLVVLHHIAADGWSLGVLANDLSVAYAGRLQGQTPQWQPLPMRYVDYAIRQRQDMAGERLRREVARGQARLQGIEALSLPADHVPPGATLHRNGTEAFLVDAALSRSIDRLAGAEGCTPFMVLLAGLHILLFRFGAQPDHTVGTPIAGRLSSEHEPLIGFFANTLILRAAVSADATFRETLQHTRAHVLDAFEHQELPFEKLVMEINPPREPGRNPLFQVVLALQNLPEESLALAGTVARPLPLPGRLAKFDLHFRLIPHDGQYPGELRFNADLFSPESARTLVRSFLALLQDACGQPDLRVDELSLLDTQHRDLVCHRWTGQAAAYPRDGTVHALFDRQAARQPQATALEAGGVRMTYGELKARSDRLAQVLRQRGAVPGEMTGLLFGRCPDLVAGALAILRTGGAFVPLDPGMPPARLAFLIRDAGIRTVLTCDALADGLQGLAVAVVAVEPSPADGPTAAEPFACAGVDADAVASVMYTSGSTGQPKGACISHRNIVRLVCGQDYVPFGPERRFLLHSPFHFDASTFELWGALLNGGVCVLAPADIVQVPVLARTIAMHRVDVLWLTASLFNLVIDEAPEVLAPVRWLLSGGEALSVVHVRKALAALPQTQLINGYGPTETTTFATCYPVPKALPANVRSIPIGTPLANTTCHVLDATGQPCPPGVAGELHIGGDGVAAGYLGRPALDAERFVRPAGLAGQRVYRTGDRVRWRHDGNLEFLGRLDDQVKLNGYRIEPGEIVAALLERPVIRQAAVVVREDAPGMRRLVAYVSGDAGIDPGAERRRLEQRLPDYLVPAVVMVVAQMPLNANGKLDRGALPAPVPDAGPSSLPALPRNATERRLAELWQELLGTGAVGIHDNFFALGGHSLIASRLCLRIGREFGVDLPMRVLFDTPTVAGLATQLAGLGGDRMRRFAHTFAVVRPSTGGDYVICVGGRIAELLDTLPAAVGILFLGSGDGDPVAFHRRGIDAAVEDYAAAIHRLAPLGRLVITGFSYGGLVAYALAARLRGSTGHAVDAVLLEPALFLPQPSRRALFLDRLKHYGKRVRLEGPGVIWQTVKSRMEGRMHVTVMPEPDEAGQELTEGERMWAQVGPELRRNVSGYRPRPTDSRGLHIVAGEGWINTRLPQFKRRFSPSPDVHPLGRIQHHDLVDDPRCIAVWRQVITDRFRLAG